MSASEHHRRSAEKRSLTIGLLTVSDSRTVENDRSGAVARELVESAGHRVADYRVLPDEPEQVAHRVRLWLAREDCDAVVVSGGTGVSPRDRTHEALAGLLDIRLDGFGELFRMLSFDQVGSAAMLSRAVGGIAGGKPVFALPGAPRAVELALKKLILPELNHLVAELTK